MAFSRGPKIVTSDLVLTIDAANTKSYPGSGTAWNDLSGNSEDFTLYNSPSFSSTTNSGTLTFDGSNDYAQANTAKVIPDTGAFSVVFAFAITNTGGRGGIFERNSNAPYNGLSFGQGGAGSWYSSIIGPDDTLSLSFTYPTTNVFRIDVVTYNGSTSAKAYSNGSLVNSDTSSGIGNLSSSGTRDSMNIARRTTNYLPVKVGCVQIYTKELSASEVLQNYNALKGRFGL